MIRVDVLIYGAGLLTAFSALVAYQQPTEINRGCIASAYQAEMRGFDLQENLAACN